MPEFELWIQFYNCTVCLFKSLLVILEHFGLINLKAVLKNTHNVRLVMVL